MFFAAIEEIGNKKEKENVNKNPIKDNHISFLSADRIGSHETGKLYYKYNRSTEGRPPLKSYENQSLTHISIYIKIRAIVFWGYKNI